MERWLLHGSNEINCLTLPNPKRAGLSQVMRFVTPNTFRRCGCRTKTTRRYIYFGAPKPVRQFGFEAMTVLRRVDEQLPWPKLCLASTRSLRWGRQTENSAWVVAWIGPRLTPPHAAQPVQHPRPHLRRGRKTKPASQDSYYKLSRGLRDKVSLNS